MRICIDKRNGKVVPDFQGSPSEGTLLKNAVNALGGTFADYEEREVDDVEYKEKLDAFMLETKPLRDAAKKANDDMRKSAKDKLKALGLTNEEITLFIV